MSPDTVYREMKRQKFSILKSGYAIINKDDLYINHKKQKLIYITFLAFLIVKNYNHIFNYIINKKKKT